MKCIVVDDELIALEGIAAYARRTPFLELTGQCSNGFEAIELITKSHVDLVFLDINMPDLTGIEMIRSIPNPPMIIFTTAYPDYALKGFELNAVDYVLKPISYEKFLAASQKALRLFSSVQEEEKKDDFVYVKVDKKLVKVRFKEIVFIESLKDYVRIHTKGGKLVAYLSLNKLKEALPTGKFIQVHKSFIVALDAIDAIDGGMIEIGANRIPIGRTFKDAVFEQTVDLKYLKK